jgi:hypothetical protein
LPGKANGTYSPLAIEYPSDLNAQTFTLTETSLIVVANAGANPMTVRVTATFSDGQKATAEWSTGHRRHWREGQVRAVTSP